MSDSILTINIPEAMVTTLVKDHGMDAITITKMVLESLEQELVGEVQSVIDKESENVED